MRGSDYAPDVRTDERADGGYDLYMAYHLWLDGGAKGQAASQ